jgi:hypothetical protein
MDLDRKELIAGHPIKKVRDFLKSHFEYEIDVSSDQQLGAEYFGNDSETVLTELIEPGWLEESRRTWTPPAAITAAKPAASLSSRRTTEQSMSGKGIFIRTIACRTSRPSNGNDSIHRSICFVLRVDEAVGDGP